MDLLKDLTDTVRRALAEDIGDGDLTAALIPAANTSRATVISREAAVICGQPWFDEVFKQLDPGVDIHWQVQEGDSVQAGQALCQLLGPSRVLLTGERTALNLLQTLSATATQAHRYAQAVKDTGATILDTRKTLPGLRTAQKYAVRCGGASNHRVGLFDGILIKENHIQAAGSITQAVQLAKQQSAQILIEVEVENLNQLKEAIKAGADRLLLDNMSLSELAQAVKLANGKVQLEASGGVTLATIKAIAATGVDFISVGDITKNLQAIDLSMRFS